jgi:hypothetical protein
MGLCPLWLGGRNTVILKVPLPRRGLHLPSMAVMLLPAQMDGLPCRGWMHICDFVLQNVCALTHSP